MTHLRPLVLGAFLLSACSSEDPTLPQIPTNEAAFVDIESVDYALHGDFGRHTFHSSPARLFYSFQPADNSPEEKPLAVVWSGGPGIGSEVLMAFGAGRMSLDSQWNGGDTIGPSPTSWTQFANVLFIDARATGFSYGLLDDPSNAAARADEFALRNFNAWIDAADFVRVLLRFFATHPQLERTAVVFIAESYGGTRASIVLHLLAHPDLYGNGSAPYEDSALAAEIRKHLEVTGAADANAPIDPARVAMQFGTQVLIQPRLTGHQSTVTGAQLEAPGSILDEIALETGIPFVRCANKPPGCDAYMNALGYLGGVGRDIYHVDWPKGKTFAQFDVVSNKIVLPEVFTPFFGVSPKQVAGLSANSREGAYRTSTESPAPSPLDEQLGTLPPWDRYYLVDASSLVNTVFRGFDAMNNAVEIPHVRWGDLFLDNLRYTRTMITAAQKDAVIYAPAIAPAIAMHTQKVTSAVEEMAPGGRIRVDYPDGESRFIRFPKYEAGHVVTLDVPDELAGDIQAFLIE